MATDPALGGDGGVVGLHHVITAREGSPFLLIPWRYRFPFALRTIIRGWFGRTLVVRRVVPERSGPGTPWRP